MKRLFPLPSLLLGGLLAANILASLPAQAFLRESVSATSSEAANTASSAPSSGYSWVSPDTCIDRDGKKVPPENVVELCPKRVHYPADVKAPYLVAPKSGAKLQKAGWLFGWSCGDITPTHDFDTDFLGFTDNLQDCVDRYNQCKQQKGYTSNVYSPHWANDRKNTPKTFRCLGVNDKRVPPALDEDNRYDDDNRD